MEVAVALLVVAVALAGRMVVEAMFFFGATTMLIIYTRIYFIKKLYTATR